MKTRPFQNFSAVLPKESVGVSSISTLTIAETPWESPICQYRFDDYSQLAQRAGYTLESISEK